jgi:HprK-related kinase A
VIVADVPIHELHQRLSGPGIALRTGFLVNVIRSAIPSVAEAIALLYSNHPLEDSNAFADFHVNVRPPAGVRRWLRRQVLFEFDGTRPFKPLPLPQAFPMLEWGMNWCISNHLNSFLIFHAAVIAKENRALILAAPPGYGKSTLCAALVNRGWRLLSDELTLIDPESGFALPLVRPVSLKNASIGVIRDFAPNAPLSLIVNDTVKGSVAHMQPPIGSVRRADEPANPHWVVFPRYQSGVATTLSPYPKARAFMQLADNAFNYNVHGTKGFDTVADLIGSSGCYEFSYSNLDEAVSAFDALAKSAS